MALNSAASDRNRNVAPGRSNRVVAAASGGLFGKAEGDASARATRWGGVGGCDRSPARARRRALPIGSTVEEAREPVAAPKAPLLGMGTLRRRCSAMRSLWRSGSTGRCGRSSADRRCVSANRRNRPAARAAPSMRSVASSLLIIGTGDRGAADIFDLDLRGADRLVLQRLGRLGGKVHDAAAVIGAAIVDADDDRAVVAQIGHARIARQRHGRMRGGDGETCHRLRHWRCGGRGRRRHTRRRGRPRRYFFSLGT